MTKNKAFDKPVTVQDFCGPESNCAGYILAGNYTSTTDEKSVTKITVEAYLSTPNAEDFNIVDDPEYNTHIISWGISPMPERKKKEKKDPVDVKGVEIWT